MESGVGLVGSYITHDTLHIPQDWRIRRKKAPRLPWAPSTLNPTSTGGYPPRGGVASLHAMGLPTPTGAGFPVTWCWLTLTGTSRTAQGCSQPSTLEAEVKREWQSGKVARCHGHVATQPLSHSSGACRCRGCRTVKTSGCPLFSKRLKRHNGICEDGSLGNSWNEFLRFGK